MPAGRVYLGTSLITGSTPRQQTTLNFTTGSLAAQASESFQFSSLTTSVLLSYTSSYPSWVRVYGTSAARTADTRTSPGGTVPAAGAEFYAELVTSSTPQTIRLSPASVIQPTGGIIYLKVQNMDSVSRILTLNFSVLAIED